MPYDPDQYWRDLHSRGDLSAVGQAGMPPEINQWLYRTFARNLRKFARRQHLLNPIPQSVFDIGAGLGYWIEFWRGLGVQRVDGCDLVPAAVERLNAKFAAGTSRFVVADVGLSVNAPLAEGYELVTCMNVLLHIMDEIRFDHALANTAQLVKPGGHLLLSEPILLEAGYDRDPQPEWESRARPLDRYRLGLEAAGLRLTAIEAGTVLGNNPMEAHSPGAYSMYWAWWSRFHGKTQSARWTRVLGPTMYALDGLAMRTGAAPTTKFALFQRPE